MMDPEEVVTTVTVFVPPPAWPQWNDVERLNWLRENLRRMPRTRGPNLGAVHAGMVAERDRIKARVAYQKHITSLAGAEKTRLWEKQGGECAVCRGDITPMGAQLDHDHSCCPGPVSRACGKCFRGLLCGACNRALGLFRDDPVLLRAAIEYLGG